MRAAEKSPSNSALKGMPSLEQMPSCVGRSRSQARLSLKDRVAATGGTTIVLSADPKDGLFRGGDDDLMCVLASCTIPHWIREPCVR